MYLVFLGLLAGVSRQFGPPPPGTILAGAQYQAEQQGYHLQFLRGSLQKD